MKAQSVINSCKEKNQNPVKVIFGGRELFVKLKRSHLTGERRKKLKREWKEKRLLLYSRGDKSKAGNLNLRLIKEKDDWYLRINTGNREWIKAKVIRSVKRETRQVDRLHMETNRSGANKQLVSLQCGDKS